jgi:hypothetical protein
VPKFAFIAIVALLILPPPALGESGRQVLVNGERLSDRELLALEQGYGIRIEDADYWYDRISGAWGLSGGPAAGVIMPGLELGGPLAADPSAGNTGVFINGRELHPVDVAGLRNLFGVVYPGRWYLLANGNLGPEGGPPIANLYQALQARGGGSSWRSPTTGSSGGASGGSGYVMGRDASGNAWSVTY